MKKYFLVLFNLLIFTPIAFSAERQIQCKVVGISDGDTLTCLLERTPIKIRLQHIDAPESTQAFGNRAKQALANLTFKKNVTIHISGYDKYQRLLGVIYDGKQNINLTLVELGMAWAYSQTHPIYQQAQQQAQANKIGLWRDPNPINPADWRASKRSDTTQNLQKFPNNVPLGIVDCRKQLSCKEMERRGFSYTQVQQHFQQCGWKERDGNKDGIPCNRLYRKAQQR